MAFSTSGPIRAWRFSDLEPEIISSMLGWPAKEAKSRLAALRRQHEDPAWIDATLARLSVPSLAVLALLVEGRGSVERDEMVNALHARFGVAREHVHGAIDAVFREVLAVPLEAGTRTSMALVEPSAALVAARVRDLDLPPLALDSPVAWSERCDDGRALLATCCAMRHVELKQTKSGMPHRAGVKRFAKAIGMAEDVVDRLLVLGVQLGLEVAGDDEALRPVVPRLLDAAAGRFPTNPLVSAFCEHLRALGKPITHDHVTRWTFDTARFSYASFPLPAALGALPGIRAGTVGTTEVLAAASLDGTAAASITPSFEVFLPPESALVHVVQVLGCAELVRVDRVIVARITKAAVQRAAAAGDTGESIALALASACRTPVPQNVVAAITDWAGDVATAISAVGRVVVVPSAESARVAAALEHLAPRVLAPGVLLLPEDTPPRAITTALLKIGVHERGMIDTTLDTEAEPTIDPRRPYPTLAMGDPALQARYAAYRGGDAGEHALAARNAPQRPALERDDDSDVAFSAAAMAAVERWERDRGCTLSDNDAVAGAALLDVIDDLDRRFLLDAPTPAQFAQRLNEIIVNRGGMHKFFAKHAELVRNIVPRDLVELVRATDPARRRRVDATAATSSLEWHATDLHARLTAAARTHDTYVLDLGNGHLPTVRISRLLPRGSVVMVLGEDITDESALAVPLASIRRIAAAPAEPTEVTDHATTSPAWRPLPGQATPPGHVRCPCGSGKRYRACCRVSN